MRVRGRRYVWGRMVRYWGWGVSNCLSGALRVYLYRYGFDKGFGDDVKIVWWVGEKEWGYRYSADLETRKRNFVDDHSLFQRGSDDHNKTGTPSISSRGRDRLSAGDFFEH